MQLNLELKWERSHNIFTNM